MEQKSKSDINTENLEEEKEEELNEISLTDGKVLDLNNFVGGNPKDTLEKMEIKEVKLK